MLIYLLNIFGGLILKVKVNKKIDINLEIYSLIYLLLKLNENENRMR